MYCLNGGLICYQRLVESGMLQWGHWEGGWRGTAQSVRSLYLFHRPFVPSPRKPCKGTPQHDSQLLTAVVVVSRTIKKNAKF